MERLIGVSYTRFKDIKKFFAYSFCDPEVDQGDPWWRIHGFVDAYNENRRTNVAASFIKLFNESMSAWHPQTTKTGGLFHLSFISWKPEPLGTEFKMAGCSKTKVGLALEIQEGKAPMNEKGP